ncbi:hypothetical protein CHS0354_038739 [Potamilus streckersoni]|uniref:Uncharacterized protein n=1 Tax=Potamilus streckersoni TaxID=2493646 RepID=A0AAE0W083_9BIVA|nr:hypothetical protein CHS0354_038739 [Potamilus streckersoni]
MSASDMAFAKVFILVIFFLTECNFCFGYVQNRIKREDANDESDFSELFNAFLNNLFGGQNSTSNATVPVTTETNWPQQSARYPSTRVASGEDFTSTSKSETQQPHTDYTTVTTLSSEEKMCLLDPILQNFCTITEELTDVSFFDLYSLLFSDTVLDGLLVDCRPGDWCLRNRFNYWDALIMEKVDMVMNSAISAAICEPGIKQCLDAVTENYSNCSVYSTMRFTAESIDLLCQIKKDKTPGEECYKRVLATLHISLADLSRELGENFRDSAVDNICQTSKYEMTKNYVCMTESCPYQSDVLSSFPSWGWFIGDVPTITYECRIKTTCEALNQVGSTENPSYSSSKVITPDESDDAPSDYDEYYNDMRERTTAAATSIEYASTRKNAEEIGSDQVHVIWIYDSDVKMMIGISMATIVTLIVMAASFCICWRRRHLLAVNKDGYTQLLSEDNES